MKSIVAATALILILLLLNGCDSSSSPVEQVDLSTARVGYSGGFVDLDGDGSEDLLVGAPDAKASPSKGAVLAYYKKAEGYATERAWEIMGDGQGDSMGYAFANVGDVDGDSFDDYAVGAVNSKGDAPLSGAVNVYRGGQDGPVILASLKGNLPLDKFGYRIAGGDLNNDGNSDVIVSAVYETADAYQSGTVSIFLGGDTIGATPDIVIRGTQSNGGTGYGIATGDINGDSITDLFIGGGHSVLIYYGGNDLVERLAFSQEADVHINGQSEGGGGHSGHGFGDAILYLGDVNNDGFGDLAVSNWRRSAPDSPDYRGSVNIFKGSNMLPHEFFENNTEFLLAQITGLANTDIFGTALALAPDLNNGGLPDLLVSAPWATGGLSSDMKASGCIYLFHFEEILQDGPAFLDAGAAVRTYTVDNPSGEFGMALATGSGNIFFAGAPSADKNRGKAFLIDGQTGKTTELAAY